MSVRINIHGATPVGGKALCHTCKHAVIVKGQNCEEVILCGEAFYRNGNGIVPFKVSSCTAYVDKNHPEKYEMEQMAWKIEVRKRGATGFIDGQPQSNEMGITIEPPSKDEERRPL